MKLARKLTAALVLVILAVMGGYAYFQTRQEIVLSRADLQRARRLALAWIGVIESVWRREGAERAEQLAHRATARSREIRLRLMPLDPAADMAELQPSAEERRTLMSAKAIRRRYRDSNGKDWLQFYYLLTVNHTHPAAVEYLEPSSPHETFIQMSHQALAIATLMIVGLCGLVVAVLDHWWVGRPLQLLRDKARRAGDGDFSAPLQLRQQDEIGELAREINAMCTRIADTNRRFAEEHEARLVALDQLRHTDRLATIGQIAAGIAHELGTPLNIASGRAELIAANELPREEVMRSARTIVEQIDRMATIVRELLDFSRRQRQHRSATDLRQLVANTVDLIRGVANKAGVSIDCHLGTTPALVAVDPNQVQQALMNLLMNGVQAMPNGGVLRVSVESRHAEPPPGVAAGAREYWCVNVTDAGMGIAPADLERLFEPFFTTKKMGEGTGLGLPVARDIVTEHGGWITVDSNVGRGSRFTIVLPPADIVQAAPQQRDHALSPIQR